MASDIDRTFATARRFMVVVQYFWHFVFTSRVIGFCNVECEMLNVRLNLTVLAYNMASNNPNKMRLIPVWGLIIICEGDIIWRLLISSSSCIALHLDQGYSIMVTHVGESYSYVVKNEFTRWRKYTAGPPVLRAVRIQTSSSLVPQVLENCKKYNYANFYAHFSAQLAQLIA